STKTATQAYAIGYTGDIPTGLGELLTATNLKLVPVIDPAAAAKQQVDLGVAFKAGEIDEYYDPTRQSPQIADIRLPTVLGRYNHQPCRGGGRHRFDVRRADADLAARAF